VTDIAAPPALTSEVQRNMLRQMLEIRGFEHKVIELFREGLVRGATHTYVGEEAIAVGACSALRQDDFITSTHRGHGHCIAKGGDLSLMMAELLGKATGYCKGKGGSMHIADLDKGILGANGIVAGGVGIATGAGLSCKLRKTDQVVVCFFGDGGINQGILYECANFAAIWSLPVIFICENNQYAMSTHWSTTNAVADLSGRGQAFGIPSATIDGMDVMAVYETVSHAVARARAGQGPSFIVAMTYRFFGHHIADSLVYRSREETASWQEKDAIDRLRAQMIAAGTLTQSEAEAIQQKAKDDVEAATLFARESPEPDPETLLADIYG
jgi:TPP-dependent pyruvate/acetoin dehydrogenase alpha subunit